MSFPAVGDPTLFAGAARCGASIRCAVLKCFGGGGPPASATGATKKRSERERAREDAGCHTSKPSHRPGSGQLTRRQISRSRRPTGPGNPTRHRGCPRRRRWADHRARSGCRTASPPRDRRARPCCRISTSAGRSSRMPTCSRSKRTCTCGRRPARGLRSAESASLLRTRCRSRRSIVMLRFVKPPPDQPKYRSSTIISFAWM